MKNTEHKSKAVEIISKLVTLVGVTAGIILVSIGAIMILQSFLTIYVFGIDTPQYGGYNEFSCEMYDVEKIKARKLSGYQSFGPIAAPVNIDKSSPQNTKIKKELSQEDKEFLSKKYEECKEKTKKEGKEKFIRGEKHDIANGIAFLITGFALLFFYKTKRKKKA